MSNKIVTSCKKCKWSNYNGKTQIGCVFNLLDKYRNAGINVIEAYDEEQDFFVIDRICLFSRPTDHPATKEDVINQTKVRYQVIYILTEKDLDIEYFSYCLNSFVQQDIPPQHITIIRPFDMEVQPFKYTKLLAKTNIKWRYQDTMNPELSYDDLIDIAIDANAYPYYIRLCTSSSLPKEFSTEFNTLVNDQFKIFAYLYDDTKSIEVVATTYHKQTGGNAFKSLRDKIWEDKELSKIIFKVNDTIPCLF